MPLSLQYDRISFEWYFKVYRYIFNLIRRNWIEVNTWCNQLRKISSHKGMEICKDILLVRKYFLINVYRHYFCSSSENTTREDSLVEIFRLEFSIFTSFHIVALYQSHFSCNVDIPPHTCGICWRHLLDGSHLGFGCNIAMLRGRSLSGCGFSWWWLLWSSANCSHLWTACYEVENLHFMFIRRAEFLLCDIWDDAIL